MSVIGLNHITLAVADLNRSVQFYRDVLGFHLRALWQDGAYLEAGSLWLCLSVEPVMSSQIRPDYTHIAFSVADEFYADMNERVRSCCIIWKDNSSEGDSTYFLDPDGHMLELHLGSLASRLAHYSRHPEKGVSVY